jgi:hypothetical protein
MKTQIKQYSEPEGDDQYVSLGIKHKLTNDTFFMGAIGWCRPTEGQSTEAAKTAALRDALETLEDAAAAIRKLLP